MLDGDIKVAKRVALKEYRENNGDE